MELWEQPAERYIALGSLVVIAVSLAILAGKRLTEPATLILETPPQKPATSRPVLKVHVKGAVQRPSVYTLPFGSRVIDAVQKAQPRPDADLNALNLASFLEDGQEVIVPSKNLTLIPLPDHQPFTVTLLLDKLLGKTVRIAAIEAINEDGKVVGKVQFNQTRNEVTFKTQTGVFGYRLVAEIK